MLELGVADEVLVGAAGSFADSLRRARPDILALGYDQKLPDADTEAAARESRVRVVGLPWSAGKEEHHACQYIF
jgi:glycerol-3-phosphate cytidylyltransferase-like family protein